MCLLEGLAQSGVIIGQGLRAAVRVCLRACAFVDCRKQATGIGVQLEPCRDFLEHDRGEQSLVGEHSFRAGQQRFKDLLALDRIACGMPGHREGNGIAQRIRRGGRSRIGTFDVVEQVGLLRWLAVAKTIHQVEVRTHVKRNVLGGRGCSDTTG